MAADLLGLLVSVLWIVMVVALIYCCGYTGYIVRTLKCMCFLIALALAGTFALVVYNTLTEGEHIRISDMLKPAREL